MKLADKTIEMIEELIEELKLAHLHDEYLRPGIPCLIAQDGQFLGQVAPAEHPESIANITGAYGSSLSDTSILNEHCPYGGQQGAYSPFNPDCTQPPFLYIQSEFWGCVSDNERLSEERLETERFLHLLRNELQTLISGSFSKSGSMLVEK